MHEKVRYLLGLVLIFFLIGGLLYKIQDKKIYENKNELSENYQEMSLDYSPIYVENSMTSTTFCTDGEWYNCNYLGTSATITEDGKLKIDINQEHVKEQFFIELDNEKIVGLSRPISCGEATPIPYLYIATDQKNIYKSSLIYDENNKVFLPNALKKEFSKIFDGNNLSSSDQISLIHLNSKNNFTTCFEHDVYLKINNKVIDFDGNEYTTIIPTRTYSIGDNFNIGYNYDGTINVLYYDEKGNIKSTTTIVNEDYEPIEFILYGKENDNFYMLDKNGNEYYLSNDLYTYILNNLEFDGIITPTNENKIIEIRKKDSEFEIIFENNIKKHVITEYNWNIFEPIGME